MRIWKIVCKLAKCDIAANPGCRLRRSERSIQKLFNERRTMDTRVDVPCPSSPSSPSSSSSSSWFPFICGTLRVSTLVVMALIASCGLAASEMSSLSADAATLCARSRRIRWCKLKSRLSENKISRGWGQTALGRGAPVHVVAWLPSGRGGRDVAVVRVAVHPYLIGLSSSSLVLKFESTYFSEVVESQNKTEIIFALSSN